MTELGFAAMPATVYDFLVGPLMRIAGLSRHPIEPNEGNVFEPQPRGDQLTRSRAAYDASSRR